MIKKKLISNNKYIYIPMHYRVYEPKFVDKFLLEVKPTNVCNTNKSLMIILNNSCTK